MEIKLLSGALGAEIKGIDLTDVSDENFKKLMIYFLNIKLFFLEISLLPKNNKLPLQKSLDL
jgi:taurine dioxygenase